MHKHFIASSVLALFVAACSSGGSEPVTPESTAEPESTAAETSAAADMPAEPPSAAVSAAEAPAAPPAEPGPDLKIVPMKIAIDAKSPVIEVKQDGSVTVTKPGSKPTVVANVSKNELKAADGSFAIAVMKDNTLQAPDMKKKVSFDDKDNVVFEGGGQIAIDDKGKVDLTKPDGTKENIQPKITGFKPEGRRLAQLVLLVGLYRAEPVVGPPTTVTTAPATAPAPAPVPAPAGKK
jgi:glucose/arabinose dehydrogenase